MDRNLQRAFTLILRLRSSVRKPLLFKMDVQPIFHADYPIFKLDIDNFVPPVCNFASLDAVKQSVSKNMFSVLMVNIRSCRQNFNTLLAEMSSYLSLFTCIILTETWLNDANLNVYSLSGFYCLDICRPTTGGGIRMYFKDGITVNPLLDFYRMTSTLEMIAVEIMLSGKKTILSAIYHPPSSSHIINSNFIEDCSNTLGQLKSLTSSLIVCGTSI